MEDIPKRVKESIIRVAKQEWPDDYEMQKYKVNNQIESYRVLQSLRASIDDDTGTFERIFTTAQAEWPDNYEMQLYKVNNQIDALVYILEVDKLFTDVPPQVLHRIKLKALGEWPDNYEMQKYVIDNQVQAWRSLRDLQT